MNTVVNTLSLNELDNIVAEKVELYSAAAQSIPDSVETKILLDNIQWGNALMDDTLTNNRAKIVTAGHYIIVARSQSTESTAGLNRRIIIVRKNSSDVEQERIYHGMYKPSDAVAYYYEISGIMECDVDDTIELWIYQDSGGALDFGGVSYADASRITLVKFNY